jgi:hypothetical protein
LLTGEMIFYNKGVRGAVDCKIDFYRSTCRGPGKNSRKGKG